VRGHAINLTKLYNDAAADAGLTRRIVTCRTCRREKTVNGAECLRHGWPKCHGQTMTLDPLPPKERQP